MNFGPPTTSSLMSRCCWLGAHCLNPLAPWERLSGRSKRVSIRTKNEGWSEIFELCDLPPSFRGGASILGSYCGSVRRQFGGHAPHVAQPGSAQARGGFRPGNPPIASLVRHTFALRGGAHERYRHRLYSHAVPAHCPGQTIVRSHLFLVPHLHRREARASFSRQTLAAGAGPLACLPRFARDRRIAIPHPI